MTPEDVKKLREEVERWKTRAHTYAAWAYDVAETLEERRVIAQEEGR